MLIGSHCWDTWKSQQSRLTTATSEVFFSKLNYFIFEYFDPKFFDNKFFFFWGDLGGILAKKEAPLSTGTHLDDSMGPSAHQFWFLIPSSSSRSQHQQVALTSDSGIRRRCFGSSTGVHLSPTLVPLWWFEKRRPGMQVSRNRLLFPGQPPGKDWPALRVRTSYHAAPRVSLCTVGPVIIQFRQHWMTTIWILIAHLVDEIGTKNTRADRYYL